ncbi:MAG: transglutaminase domain-containing protein [bacterium LCO1.1]|uniref:Transglutaminase domain-containing protein n=1 Tax=Candidatus Weimeria bifida TaxID=2599074 RepID=A0A6N7J1R0_9FIRM|nr:transglutaminase domain-containing protein [Candidatus Weimeria bifida]
MTYYFSKAKDGKAPALVNKTKKVSGKTLYFSNTGKGFISCGNTEGNQAVASVIEGAKLSNSMTQDQKLSVVYNYILNKYNYTISDPADLSSNQWIYTCAYNMFKYGDAKCYNYAALTGLSANALGFNVRFETGVAARSAGGEKTEHAWVVVNDQYVLDSCYDDVNNKSGNQYFYKTYDEIRDSEGSEYQVNKTFTLSD